MIYTKEVENRHPWAAGCTQLPAHRVYCTRPTPRLPSASAAPRCADGTHCSLRSAPAGRIPPPKAALPAACAAGHKPGSFGFPHSFSVCIQHTGPGARIGAKQGRSFCFTDPALHPRSAPDQWALQCTGRLPHLPRWAAY